MNDQAKKLVKNERRTLAFYTAGCIIGAAVGIAAYIKVCESAGYKMVRPTPMVGRNGEPLFMTRSGKLIGTHNSVV